MSTRILIVGGLGFIGANLAKYLAEQGERVLLTRHQKSANPSYLEQIAGENVQIISFDIMNLARIRSVIQKYEIASIFNFASVYEPYADPYEAFHVNVQGQVNLLEVMRLEGLRKIIFASSVAVYRGVSGIRLVGETHPIPIEPVTNIITATKRAAETMSNLYGHVYGIDSIMVRIGNVYGPFYTVSLPPSSSRNPMLTMVRNAARGNSTRIPVSEKTQYEYIYVKDLVRALGLLHSRHSLKYRSYNIGGGKAVSLAEVAEVITNLVPEVKIDFCTGEPGVESKGLITQTLEYGMDISRIREELNYVPEFSLEQGIKSYIQWFKEGNH